MEYAFVKETENGELIFSTSAICKVFKIDSHTLIQWADKGCPKVERGWWNLREVLLWKGMLKDGNKPKSNEVKKAEAEADAKYAKARQEELKLQEMLGNLVPFEMVEANLNATFTDIRQTLLALPEEIRTETHTLYPEFSIEVTRVADEKVRNCLERLAQFNSRRNDTEVGTETKKRGRPRKKAIRSTEEDNSK